jgi:hypothetical protein
MVGDVEKTNPILFFTAEHAGCAELYKMIILSNFSAFFAISAVNEVEKTNPISSYCVLRIAYCVWNLKKQTQFVSDITTVSACS